MFFFSAIDCEAITKAMKQLFVSQQQLTLCLKVARKSINISNNVLIM